MPASTSHCSVRETAARPTPGTSRRTRSYRSSADRCPFSRTNTSTIWSRLEERFRPSGRAEFRALIRREALTAAARRGRVRVLDGEAATGDGVDEVHFSTVQVADADGVDVELHAVRFEHLIARAL